MESRLATETVAANHRPGRRRLLRPGQMVEAVWHIDPRRLRRRGIRGLILDLDNTLVNWNQVTLRPEVLRWIEEANGQELRCCVLTNARTGRRVAAVADRLGASYLIKAGKPFPRAYRKAMRRLGTTPETTAVIGDQVFTDILGANLLGIETILVEPFLFREFIGTRFVRLIERPLRWWWLRNAGRRPA